MKIKSYIIGALAAAALLPSAACQDDFDAPNITPPVATLQPNMTILELKQKYWNDANNFIAPIGGYCKDANGDSITFQTEVSLEGATFVPDDKQYVIAARVVSSDESGNIYKNLVIQDETAAITMSINSTNLYLKYRVGQEVLIDLKGMYIGKYNGLLQLGMPEWYANGSAWEATFMGNEFFEEHVQLNGFPEPEKIDTIVINSFSDLTANPDVYMRYQSQLVRFNNVSFQNGGKETFSTYQNNVNQYVNDAYNNSPLILRSSGYSNFWSKMLPTGSGDLVVILGTFGTNWQMQLIDFAGVLNFGNPTLPAGTENNPYSVTEVISNIANLKPTEGWVKGYIVGAPAPEVTEIKANSDVEWKSDPIVDNYLVIGAEPNTTDINDALVVYLPQGSALRKYGNLVDNPGNYQKEILINGKFDYVMSTYGITNDSGAASLFKIEGVEIPTLTITELYKEAFKNTAGEFIINNVKMASALNYVWSPTEAYGMKASAFVNNANQDAESWLISPVFDFASAEEVKLSFSTANNKFASVSDVPKQCTLWVSIDGGDWQQLTIPKYGSNNDWTFVESGDIDLAAYSGKKISLGFKYTSNTTSGGTWEIKDFTLTGAGKITTSKAIIPGGGTTPDTPPTPAGNTADFDTFNNGQTGTNYGATYTTASGWTTTQCTILSGGTSSTNFVSTSATTLFPCLNGSAANQGILTSPVLSGGLKSLTFSYGFPFNESKAGFTVQILQNGEVVASDKVVADPATRDKAFTYSHDFDITGSFTIKIVNDQVSQSTKSNSDRVAIWALSWK